MLTAQLVDLAKSLADKQVFDGDRPTFSLTCRVTSEVDARFITLIRTNCFMTFITSFMAIRELHRNALYYRAIRREKYYMPETALFNDDPLYDVIESTIVAEHKTIAKGTVGSHFLAYPSWECDGHDPQKDCNLPKEVLVLYAPEDAVTNLMFIEQLGEVLAETHGFRHQGLVLEPARVTSDQVCEAYPASFYHQTWTVIHQRDGTYNIRKLADVRLFATPAMPEIAPQATLDAEMPQYEINNLTIEGDTEEGSMMPDGKLPPFALFSPDLQRNVGGPYDSRHSAVMALLAMRNGKMVPYCDCPGYWCINGVRSPWYDEERRSNDD